MLAAKSFVATSDMAALERWLGILADELSDRMIYDSQVNQRFPRNLVLSYRCLTSTDAPYPHPWSGALVNWIPLMCIISNTIYFHGVVDEQAAKPNCIYTCFVASQMSMAFPSPVSIFVLTTP